MFLSTNSVEIIMRCDFCNGKFIDVVKHINDCGSTICGKCYDEARDSIKLGSQFKCKACQVLHIMPRSGLADVKKIMRMLQIKPEVKALSDEAIVLKRRIEEAKAYIDRLKSFDDQAEINGYCDRLEKEVKDTVEAGVRHLHKIGDRFLKEVQEYREKLLSARPKIAPTTTKRNRANLGADQSTMSARQEVERLTREMDEYSAKWYQCFTEINQAPSSRDIAKGQERVSELTQRAKQVEARLISTALNGRFMRLRDHQAFMRNNKILGRLSLENTAEGNLIKDLGLVQTIQAHSEAVRRVMFLDNGRLATSSRDNLIKIWNPANGELIHELTGHSSWVLALAQLPNHWLVSASRDSTIKVWDLNEKRAVRTLTGHTNSVFSLKTLPNGLLASASFDDTIKIWDPYMPEKPLVYSMKGHGIQNSPVDINLLPNGHLVTCSNESEVENTLRVWNSRTGELVKSIKTHSKKAHSLLALSHGRVAVGYISGDIKFFETDSDVEHNRSPLKHGGDVGSMLMLPSGYLLSAGLEEDCDLKIWNSTNSQLIQTITTGHVDGIFSIALSEDGKYLATGSHDKSVKIWSLSY